MITTFRLRAAELNDEVLQSIKAMFGKKEIEISVTEAIDDTTYLLQSAANAKVLKTRMANVKAGKKLVKADMASLKKNLK